jgi:hypothetical protein
VQAADFAQKSCNLQGEVASRIYLGFKALVTFLFSSIGSTLIFYSSQFELHLTNTANVGATMFKLAIFNLLNYYVVTTAAVWLVSREDKEGESLWCFLEVYDCLSLNCLK